MTEIYTEFIHQTSRELARLLSSKLPIEKIEQVQYKDQEAKAILTPVGQAAMRLVFYPLAACYHAAAFSRARARDL